MKTHNGKTFNLKNIKPGQEKNYFLFQDSNSINTKIYYSISEILAIGFCEGNRTLEPLDVESLISSFLIQNVLHGFVLEPWDYVACCVVDCFSFNKNNYITLTYDIGHLDLCNCCICNKTVYHMTELKKEVVILYSSGDCVAKFSGQNGESLIPCLQ